ncbi:Predicted arabinose efflux permease, MFS family [Enhydrobacter aerosaccus]|uniref:Predicted arabinose efflux permease, MFS family n=1 Tax=Enhydrobacter aerosaccus TaxID=225324 RepID=A0A1T4JZK2_9HYPH|nr:MFS transporter [Enhydrobacter aerosaccus]SJZ35682.1 Predicted arabinose efflux permease, MFS family [Enhydrobacter aerosaccus]
MGAEINLTSATVDQATPYRSLWAACFLGYAAIGMTIQVMPSYAHDRLGAGDVAAGMAVTIGSFATMLTRPLAGRLADRHGGRGVVMAGSILGMLGGLGHLIATTLPVLIAARLALGAGEGALFTASIGWVLQQAEPSQRGRVVGHFGLSMWTGLAAGPVLGAAILAIGTYRSVWIAASAFPIIAWMLIAQTRRSASAPPTSSNIRRALLPRAAWIPGASNVFASMGYGVVAAFLVPRFAVLHLMGQDLALAIFGITFMVTRFVGSASVDRFGPRRVILVVFLVEAAGLGGLYFAETAWSAFACTALAGAGLSMLYPCLASLVTEAADPRERSAALGAVTSGWDLGLAAGGPLGGLVAGTSNAGPFALGAVAALMAALPLVLAPKHLIAPLHQKG